MKFSQIHSFYLVAKLGTYQAAAERLNATQPAISARIVALENSLGARLFDRSGYRVTLTPQGREFLSYAERLVELETEARLQVTGDAEMSGSILIGASDTMVSSWLPDSWRNAPNPSLKDDSWFSRARAAKWRRRCARREGRSTSPGRSIVAPGPAFRGAAPALAVRTRRCAPEPGRR